MTNNFLDTFLRIRASGVVGFRAMKMRVAAAFFLLVLAAVGQDADKPTTSVPEKPPAKSEPVLKPSLYRLFGNYAGWWNALSDAEKDSFIDGYTIAMERANSLSVGMCKATMKEAQPGHADFNEKFYGGMAMCMLGEDFAFKVEKPLKPLLDDFYREPLNLRIPERFAMDYVRDEATGKKTAGQLLDELNEWRKIVNH